MCFRFFRHFGRGYPPAITTLSAPSINQDASTLLLQATHGTYQGVVDSIAGEWLRAGVVIEDASGMQYMPVAADSNLPVTYHERASNSNFTTDWATSNSITTSITTSVSTGTALIAEGLDQATAAGTLPIEGAGSSTEAADSSQAMQQSSILGGTGTLSAPELGYPTTANPPSVPVNNLGSDWQTGDVLKLAYSSNLDMSQPTVLQHTLTDADATPGATINMGIPTLSGETYFVAFGNDGANDSQFLSNKVAWGDSTSPTITTPLTVSIDETTHLWEPITADEPLASATITGGDDKLQFEIAEASGVFGFRFLNDGTRTASAPTDAGEDGVYNVAYEVTDFGGNTTASTLAVTVQAIDQTPDSFTFTAVSNATPSTTYSASSGTITGLATGYDIPCSLDAGEYSLDGGTTWIAAGSFTIQNGATIDVRLDASSAYSTATTITLAIGPTFTAAFTVTTEADPTAAGFTASTNQPAKNAASATSSTFSADFVDGYGVVFVEPLNGGASNRATSVSVGGVACTQQAITSDGLTSCWVTNSPVSAGVLNVVVNQSVAATSTGVMCGTLTNTTNTTPTSTAELAPFALHSNPYSTSAPVTVPAEGVGVAFTHISTTTAMQATTGELVSRSPAGQQALSRQINAGAWTPTFTGDSSRYSTILAVAFGAS